MVTVGTYTGPKVDNKVEIKLEEFVGLGVFFVSTLSSLHVIGGFNSLLTPPSLDLINFLNNAAFPSPNFLPLIHRESQTSGEIFSLSRIRDLISISWGHL